MAHSKHVYRLQGVGQVPYPMQRLNAAMTHLHEEEILLFGDTDEPAGITSIHGERHLAKHRFLGLKHAQHRGNMVGINGPHVHNIHLHTYNTEL